MDKKCRLFILSAIVAFMMATNAHAQFSVLQVLNEVDTDITLEELEHYVEAAMEINEIQQETQRSMWQTSIEAGLGVETYHRMLSEFQEDVPEVQIVAGNEMFQQFNQASERMEDIKKEMVDDIILVIEKSGLRVSRFEEIWQKVDHDSSFNMQAIKLLDEKREERRQRLIERGHGAPETETGQDTGRVSVQPDYPSHIYHFTRFGDTLWDLADSYFGNPFLWRNIQMYNTGQVVDPRRLVVGTEIRIPVAWMPEQPEPIMSVEEKREVIRTLFPLEEFRPRSFAFINQQVGLRSPIEIYVTESAIQSQIDGYDYLRGELVEPPDFLVLLIPALDIREDEEETEEMLPGITETNMLVDETRSPFGRDFYDHFYSYWEFPEGTIGFFIRIIERPVPGRGSQMIIEVNHEIVYQFQLQPGYDQIINLARSASNGLQNFLINYEEYSTQYF